MSFILQEMVTAFKEKSLVISYYKIYEFLEDLDKS